MGPSPNSFPYVQTQQRHLGCFNCLSVFDVHLNGRAGLGAPASPRVVAAAPPARGAR